MTRPLRLDPSSHSEISVRNVITVGLICVAGGNSPTSSHSGRGGGRETKRRPHDIAGPSKRRATSADRKHRLEHESGTKSRQGHFRYQPGTKFKRGSTILQPSTSRAFDCQSRIDLIKRFEAQLVHATCDKCCDNNFDPESCTWVTSAEIYAYEAPDFFPDEIGLKKAYELLRQGYEELPPEYAHLCKDVLAVIRTGFAVSQSKADRVFDDVEDAVRKINNVEPIYRAQRGAKHANPSRDDSESLRRLRVLLTRPQYGLLCLLEPLYTALTITPHSLSPKTVHRTLVWIRMSLLRHHMLTRLSSVPSMSDNIAAQYCAMLIANCRRSLNRKSDQYAPQCLHEFVRAPFRQQVALSLLEAFNSKKNLISLNICFLIAVDFLGHGEFKCPLQWKDISPLFDSGIHLYEHKRLCPQLASRLRPWLVELVALPTLQKSKAGSSCWRSERVGDLQYDSTVSETSGTNSSPCHSGISDSCTDTSP